VRRAARAQAPAGWRLAALAASFCAGVFVDGWLRTYGPPQPVMARPLAGSARASDTIVTSPSTRELDAGPRIGASPVSPPQPALAPAPSNRVNASVATTGAAPSGRLREPIDGSDVESWKGGFDERRGGGGRGHEAVDIVSPRNTPVHAVETGTIAKIFESKQGGHTVYQFSADGRLVYYYAHLERYADSLHEAQPVVQGEIIGYVGTSGNAPPNTPHLHFAVFELGSDKHWWQGQAIDPYLLFKKGLGIGD
jgi:murein DD-endopeptidase MepM/ murein hydrolase activator NlpD